MQAKTPAYTEFKYQNYKVRIEQTKEGNGEVTRVFDKSGAEVMVDANDSNCFFHGLAFDHVFIDKGTGPDGRILKIYDLKKKKMGYQGLYCIEAIVYDTGSLWFYSPVADAIANPKPFCNNGDDWVKQGLAVGYAQRKMYNLPSGSVITKSEFKCYSKQ
jgi:hypothetical protein